jgi:hypothetical protein
MPFNGSGTFTLVAGNPVVTGTSISSTVQNNTMSDFATGFTTCLTKDGQTTPTANLPMGGFYLTNAGIRAIDGTVGAPSIALNNSNSTGFYRIGADNLGLSVAGTKRWDVVAGGTTLSHNFGFSADNTHDIGASSTRPRDLFVGRNLTVSGLTSGRIPIISTAGLVVDNGALLWSSSTTNITTGGLDVNGSNRPVNGIYLQSGGYTTLSANSADVVVSAQNGEITLPLQPSFSAYNSASEANATGDGTSVTVDFDTVIFDKNSDFAADTFTAPVTGKYQFNVAVMFQSLGAAHTDIIIELVTSNRTYLWRQVVGSQAASTLSVEFSKLVDMDAADTAFVRATVSGGTKTVSIYGGGNLSTIFNGFLAN